MPIKTKYVYIFLGLASGLWLLSSWYLADSIVKSEVRAAMQEQGRNLEAKAGHLADSVKAHIEQHQDIPRLLGKEANILRALSLPIASANAHSPSRAELGAALKSDPLLKASNAYLENLAGYLHAGVIYVLNRDGVCVLSSNADKPDSFVGSDYSARHYYQAAIAGGSGYQYAMGSVSNIPGLYFSEPILDRGKTVGIAVIKIHLGDLSQWVAQARGYLVDEYGVIVLSHDPGLAMHALPGGGIDALGKEERLKRYKRADFPLLQLAQWRSPDFLAIRYFEHEQRPFILTSKSIRPELTLYVTQDFPQAMEYKQKRTALFLTLALAGLLAMSLATWRLFATRNRRQAEKTLKAAKQKTEASNRMLHTVLDTTPMRIFWKDRDLKYLGCNRLFALDAGMDSPRDLIGKDDCAMAWHDVAEIYREDDLEVMQSGQPLLHYEEPQTRSDGSLIWLRTSKVPLRDDQGEVFGVLGTYEDITARKLAEEALNAARNEAERASRAKSDFLSNMSHELRTPMNAILGYAQLLEVDATLGDEQMDNTREILKAGHHLLALISETLDLARIESGQFDVPLEPVDVGAVLAESLGLVAILAGQKEVRLERGVLADAVAMANPTRLKQAVLNLLTNAIKYNHRAGLVRVDMQASGAERIRIRVSDSGPGIPGDRLPELFQPFNRLGLENSGIEGAGIGLTIARRIVEAMGGTLGVESEVGIGSTFWIELLLAHDDNKDMREAARQDADSSGYLENKPK